MKSKNKFFISVLVLFVLGSSLAFAGNKVRADSKPWDMDIEIMLGLPVPVSFNFANVTNGTSTVAEVGSVLKVGAIVDARVNFKYLFAGVGLSYLYTRSVTGVAPSSSTGVERIHTVIPSFKVGGRIPVAQTTFLEMTIGLGGRFDNGKVSLAADLDRKGKLAYFEWLAGLGVKTYLNDLISISGGVNFHGAHSFGYKNGTVEGTLNDYNLESFAAVGFSFL